MKTENAKKQKWPPALVDSIRAELAGNARRDILTWARRVLIKPPSSAELDRAKLVLELDKGAV
jgi:hypothetical protein